MISYILALIVTAKLATIPPELLAGYQSEKDCVVAMRELNTKIPKETGVEAVCLKIQRGTDV